MKRDAEQCWHGRVAEFGAMEQAQRGARRKSNVRQLAKFIARQERLHPTPCQLRQCDCRMPLIDPDYGGTDARILIVLTDPQTPGADESGLLSFRNTDGTAQNLCRALHLAFGRNGPTAVTPWNAFPFFRSPRAGEKLKGLGVAHFEVGGRILADLLARGDRGRGGPCGRVRTIVLMGGQAEVCWKKYVLESDPSLARRFTSGTNLFMCPHPGGPNAGKSAEQRKVRRALERARDAAQFKYRPWC